MATKFKDTGEARSTLAPNYPSPRRLPVSSRATRSLETMGRSPATNTDQPPAKMNAETSFGSQAAEPIPGASALSTPTSGQLLETELPGHRIDETQNVEAGQNSSDEGQQPNVTHGIAALVGNITIECRRYEDLRRARQRLDLQAKAMCRYACDGDKTKGAKLYVEVTKNPAHPLAVWLIPYFEAMKPLDEAIKAQERAISKLGKQLPVWSWAKGVSGLGERFLGLIVGECAAPIGEYKSASAVWKRMGLAVIEGGRQRRVTGDAAIAHGYVARRRALMWNIGESIIKQQVRNPKGEDKKPIGGPVSIGPYGAIYLERKAVEVERVETPMHAHNRAKRYMEKRLLADLYSAWLAQ